MGEGAKYLCIHRAAVFAGMFIRHKTFGQKDLKTKTENAAGEPVPRLFVGNPDTLSAFPAAGVAG